MGTWALKVLGMVLLIVGFQICSSVHPEVCKFVEFVEEKLDVREGLVVVVV